MRQSLPIGVFLLVALLYPLRGGCSAVDDDPALEHMSLEELMNVNVQTAAMHSQSMESAPASISIVTAEDIRTFGSRTLAEALENVRGFYFSYDHTYINPGIGGFALPGDYATRILVLINGHAMPENIFGSANYFGEDFALDMSLVERIEIVRGTSSALYGSNGIFATINVITKRAATQHGTAVKIEGGSLGARKVTVTQQIGLGSRGALLLSGSVFNDAGQTALFFPEFNSPATNNGVAVNMDNERGYRFFSDMTLGNWRFTAVGGSRQKIQPISFGATVFNDRGTSATDQRSFVEAVYGRKSAQKEFRWRTYYDRYRYEGNYVYSLTQADLDAGYQGGYDYNHERDTGDWVGSQVVYSLPRFHGSLTVGAEGAFDIRATQSVADIAPVFVQTLLVREPDHSANGFAQQEWSAGRWSFVLGGRFDYDALRHNSFSPRLAIIYQPMKSTVVKLLYGHGFRNPNESELFFSDGRQQVGNPNLHAERADTLGATLQHRLNDSWKVSVSAYTMQDEGVIVPSYTNDGLSTYYNADRFAGHGVGADLTGRLRMVDVQSNFQWQRSGFTDMAIVPNSPSDVANLRLSMPIRDRFTLSGTLHYVSERRSLKADRLPAYYVPSIVFNAAEIMPNIDLQIGVRNVGNSAYLDPVGLVDTVDRIRQPGRTFFFSLSGHWDR